MTFEDWWEERVKPVNPDPAAKLAALSAWTFARNQEREACAKVCETVGAQEVHGCSADYMEGRQMAAVVCANTIRAR